MKRTLIFVLFWGFLFSLRAFAGLDGITLTGARVSVSEGLAGNNVNVIYEDHNGFVWIGTSSGLSRYDGYGFQNFLSLSNSSEERVNANIGKIFEDKDNDLLWIQNATFNFACYDMKAGRFVDYTDGGDKNRSFRRYLQNGSDLWLYDLANGLRRITTNKGKLDYSDYTAENGKIPNNHIPKILVGEDGNIWVLTNGGLAIIDKQGNSRIIDGNRSYLDGSIINGKMVLLADPNRVEVYGQTGKLEKWFKIPKSIGSVSKITSSFVWQGKWMVFCSKTYCIDVETEEVTRPQEYTVPKGLLLDETDGFFFESARGNDMWIFSPDGNVKKINLINDNRTVGDRYRKYKISRGTDSLFYIATYGKGLFIYDHKTGETRRFSSRHQKPVIDTDFLYYSYFDSKGNIWVAQEAMGAVCIGIGGQTLQRTLLPDPAKGGDWANYIRMVANDGFGNFIISSRDNKTYILNPLSEECRTIAETPSFTTSFHRDSEGRNWIGTYGSGVYFSDGQIGNQTDKWEHLANLETVRIMDIESDGLGRIWLSTYEDGVAIGTKGNEGKYNFIYLLRGDVNTGRTSQLEMDSKGRMWIASNNGIYIANSNLSYLEAKSMKNFSTGSGNFPLDEIKCMTFAKDGTVWVGGNGIGILRCRFSDDLNHVDYDIINKENGLPNNNVQSIAIDSFGNAWVGTQDGLARIYSKGTSVDVYKFGEKDGQDIYSENSAQALSDGRILLGTRYGLIMVDPSVISETETKGETKVIISDISVNGANAGQSGRLGCSPSYANKISLKSTENSLTLWFTSLDFSRTGQTLFEYWLEGIDKDWRPKTNVNHVDYPSLPPGTYKFHIRALTDNQWSDTKTLTIKIHQPWYNTWWAWIIYILILASIIYYVWHNGRERMRLNQQMKFNQQLTEFKLNFFTNVTHEFRTPLAIIQGAADKMIDNCQGQLKPSVQTIRRGTTRLLRLVNQLMEFRKVGTGNARLHLEQGEIVGFIRDITQDFWGQASQKEIQLTLTPSLKSHEMPFDHQMVETIIYNLLSNAIKYTPSGGRVQITLKQEEGNIVVAVEDSGPGLEDLQLQSMNQPFMLGYVAHGGMGIGLYTANKMAEIHKGSLSYKRISEEGGSIFTLTLPANGEPYKEDDYLKAASDNMRRESYETESKSLEIIKELRPKAYNDVNIAIIEDEPDMMEQISSELSVYFHTDCYVNGEKALEGIAEKKPALVVCDVMLPDISGYDIVKSLKNNPETAAIPIIMLTAMDDETHQLRSYKAGADDYMVKPCNFRILAGRAAQLINKSKEQRATIATTVQEPVIVTSQADNNFVKKMQMLTAQHISDPDFSMEKLASLMNMGRTKFFAKTKELLGVPPNKYLQNERMRIAAELVLEGELTIAEISFKVGIQDPSYFNKCFKAKFGVTPSKYGKQDSSDETEGQEKEEKNPEENV